MTKREKQIYEHIKNVVRRRRRVTIARIVTTSLAMYEKSKPTSERGQYVKELRLDALNQIKQEYPI